MNKLEYINRLQKNIDALNEYYKTLPEENYAERGITLGKMNAYLTAKLLAYDIDERVICKYAKEK